MKLQMIKLNIFEVKRKRDSYNITNLSSDFLGM